MSLFTRLFAMWIIALIALPSLIFAQETPVEEFSCFDYISSNTVTVDISSEIDTVVSGTAVDFSGMLINNSGLFFNDSILYAKVFRDDNERDVIVDQFVVQKDLAFFPNEVKNISHQWSIPANALSGEYYIGYYFVANERFYVSGTPNTEDEFASTVGFSIAGEEGADQPVYIDYDSTKINGVAYDMYAPKTEIDTNTPVTISVTLVNSTDVERVIPLQWTQFGNDAVGENDANNTKTQLAVLKPREQQVVTYVVKPQREQAVYVSVVVQDIGAKNIQNISFNQAGVHDVSLAFQGIKTIDDDEAIMFACVQTSSEAGDTGQVALELQNELGDIVHEYQQDLEAVAGISAITKTITLQDNTENYSLHTAIEYGGVIVDEVSSRLDCDKEQCGYSNNFADEDLSPADNELSPQQIVMMIVAVACLVLISIVVFVLLRKKGVSGTALKNKNDNMTPPTTITLLFLVSAFSIVALIPLDTVSANTCEPFTVSAMGYHSQNILPSDIILQQGPDVIPVEDCQAMCNTAKASLSGDWYCNWLFFNEGMQYGVVVPGTGLSNGTTVRTCLLSQSSIVYENPFVFPYSSNWSATACLAPVPINNPPNAPTITGPATGLTTGSHSFSFTATDSDGDQLRYGIDWDNNGTVDQWIPSSGYVNSGTARNASRTWSTTGSKTFRVLTQDDNIANSIWTYHTITISTPPPPTPTPTPTPTSTCTWSESNATDDFSAASTNSNMVCPAPNCPASAIDGATASPGAPASCLKSCSTSGVYRNTTTMTKVGPGCAVTPPPPAPDADLKINTLDNSVSVAPGAPLNITWTSSNTSSCTRWGAGWGSGGSVGANGGTSISASVSDTYIISCNGSQLDDVDVTVTNGGPNPPTITETVTGDVSNPFSFDINGTDPDGDNIYYQIDWNNDTNTVEASTVVVASGVSQVANRTWTTPGTYRIHARTVDAGGLMSGWTPYDVTVGGPSCTVTASWDCYDEEIIEGSNTGTVFTSCQPATSPAPATGGCVVISSVMTTNTYSGTYAAIPPGADQCGGVTSCVAPLTPSSEASVSINNGPWQTTNQNINEGDTVEVRWTSTNAGSCAGTNFTTGGGLNGVDSNPTIPTPGNTTTYSLNCAGATDTISVTKAALPNLTVSLGNPILSTTFDPATGAYTFVNVSISIVNGATPTTIPFDTIIEIDRDGDGAYEEQLSPIALNGLSGTAPSMQRQFTNIPFGTSQVRARVDTGSDVLESNETDNTSVPLSVANTPPPIDMTLTIDPSDIVRGGENATLNYDTNATFPMDCSLSGPALTTLTFDPSVAGGTGSEVAGPITAKSEYILSCTEPNTGTVYTSTATVETTGTVEEI